MKVFIPTPLRSYTGGAAAIDAQGANVRELLVDLDRRFPGIRFRMIRTGRDPPPHARVRQRRADIEPRRRARGH
jgi:hypothetical protein